MTGAPPAPSDFKTVRRGIEDWHRAVLAPGSGRVVRMTGPAIDPANGDIVVAGQCFASLDRAPSYGLYDVNRQNRALRRIEASGDEQIDPSFSPQGSLLLHRRLLSGSSRYEAAILDRATNESWSLGRFDGSVEQAAWMPGGDQIMLVVADPGVSLASVQGAVTTERPRGERRSWYPDIDDGRNPPRRRLFIAHVAQRSVREADTTANIWEAAPAGPHAVVAVATDDPAEDAWYRADLRLIHLDGRPDGFIYRADRQLLAPACDTAGRFLAVIDGLSSDRGHLAGNLVLIDLASGAARVVDTHGVDVTWTGWQGDRLVVAGIRSDDMVVLTIDAETGVATEAFALEKTNGGQRYPALGLIPGKAPEAVAVLVEAGRSEQLCVIGDGRCETLVSLASPELDAAITNYGAQRLQPVRWIASDGERIEGWLHTPPGPGPFPLAMLIHGGPIMRWVPKSLIEFSLQAALASQGFAQFMPNPRGSTGRGQTYARAVLGDMGGRDALDLIEGVDHLIGQGIADPDRLCVSGISHGGFMTSWLVTRDRRYKAGAAVSPITDWTSQRLTSDIPTFNEDYIGTPQNGLPSPILHAHKVEAKMLMIAGARDRCTPPAQAEEFHRAIRLEGGSSTLLIYPEEGHGIRSMPAASIDHLARIVSFFMEAVGSTAPHDTAPIPRTIITA